MRKRRTPQEKKRQSLAKDRRNTYGESPHGARKSIPKNKRFRARIERHAGRITPEVVTEDPYADQAIARSEARRKTAWWTKIPDSPLAGVIQANAERRKRLMANPRKRKRST